MKIRFAFLKSAALMLCLLMLGLCLSGCASGKSPSAKKVVGEVDGNPICYDELYMLANRYRAEAERLAKEKGSTLSEELDALVRENIKLHTAMIRQGEKLGLQYQQKAFDDQIELELSQIIEDSFAGDKDAYRDSLAENALTERYVRYTLGVDLFYEQLLTEYPKQGLVISETEALRDYVEENFIHVYHLVVFFDESNREEKLARITEAHERLTAGESMYSLIKQGYTEDFLDPSAKGYYITKGSMDEVYEEAAFALGLGQFSAVVESKGYNNDDVYSSCFYVIQRFELDEAYVDSNLTSLQTEYYNSVIYADLQKTLDTMRFEGNDFYRELDLTSLAAPRDGLSTGALIAIVVGGVAVFGGLLALSIVLLCRKPKKPQAALGKGSK